LCDFFFAVLFPFANIIEFKSFDNKKKGKKIEREAMSFLWGNGKHNISFVIYCKVRGKLNSTELNWIGLDWNRLDCMAMD